MEDAKVITILLLAAFLAACSSGGGSATTDDSPIAVRLSVENQDADVAKSVAFGDNVNNLSYYYTAIPQWSGASYDTVSGTVPTMTAFTNGGYLGTFQPGYWLFTVEVRNTVDDVVSVVYAGSAYTSINASSSSVSVNVSTADGTGTAEITVYVPTASETESMAISYSGTASASDLPADAARITKSGAYQYYTRFSKVISNLPSGGYTFLLDYNDGTTQSSLSGGLIGGTSIDVNVAPGATTTITGTLEGGVFREITPIIISPGFLTLNMIQEEDTPAGLMGTPGATVTLADTDTAYSVLCTPKAGTVINSYEWYLNSVFQENDDSTYLLNVPSGEYVLTCVVTGIAGNRTVTASVKSIVLVQ